MRDVMVKTRPTSHCMSSAGDVAHEVSRSQITLRWTTTAIHIIPNNMAMAIAHWRALWPGGKILAIVNARLIRANLSFLSAPKCGTS